jgi:hypothetical protein
MTPLDEKKYGDDVTNTAPRADGDVSVVASTPDAKIVVSPENTSSTFPAPPKPHPLFGHSLGGVFKSGASGSRSFRKGGNRGWEQPSHAVDSKRAQRKAQKRARKRSV